MNRRAPLPLLDLPVVDEGAVPWATVEQMREVDRLMVAELGITLERMMENAGRSVAVAARALLGGSAAGRRIVVLAGRGGNGGGGLVAARHLAVAGAHVEVTLDAAPDDLTGVVGEQLAIVRRIDLPLTDPQRPPEGPVDLVVDALLGYSASGAPREATAALVAWSAGRPVLSLDIPTGLDPVTGQLHEPGVRASATMTVAVPKDCLRAHGAGERVGELLLGDISVPARVYRAIGLEHASPFAAGPLVRVMNRRRPAAGLTHR